jgi:hypothetical protein
MLLWQKLVIFEVEMFAEIPPIFVALTLSFFENA